MPEPLVAGSEPDVAETAVLAESLATAFLVLLETLTPKERAVFLLHDVFAFDYATIGEIVGASDAGCRQLARRARVRIAERRPRFTPPSDQQERLLAGFLRACGEGDLPALLATLAEDVTVWSDGGGKVQAARRPVEGREKVARFLLGLTKLAPAGLVFSAGACQRAAGNRRLRRWAAVERGDGRDDGWRHSGDLRRPQSRQAGGGCRPGRADASALLTIPSE